MPIITHNGRQVWVPSLSPKGYRVLACKSRYILLHGSRKSTKSNTCQNKLIQHAWENDGAVVGIFSKILKSGTEGCYNDLTKPKGRIAEWIEGGIGMKFTREPTFERDTQMRYFRIRNKFGGESEVQLHSIDKENQVAEKYKDTRFSMIYLIEADRFEDPDTFRMLTAQLRVEGIPYENHQAILDTNPPEDGEDHWLYRMFIRNDSGEYVPDVTEGKYAEFNFNLTDNPFIPEAEKEDIREMWQHDPEKLDRFYYGKWTKSTAGSCFERQFVPNLHVIGDVSHPEPSERTYLLPDKASYVFPSGWDLGDSMNHAFVIGASRLVGHLAVIDIIDEWVNLGSGVEPEFIASRFVEKKKYWQRHMAAIGQSNTEWREWSDSSSLRFIAAARGSMAGELHRVSGGEITLIGVQKGAGSVAARLELLRRLLYEKRVFISASCVHTQNMLRYLKPGKTASDAVDPKSPHKHVFDALTYMLTYELAREVSRTLMPEASSQLIYT